MIILYTQNRWRSKAGVAPLAYFVNREDTRRTAMHTKDTKNLKMRRLKCIIDPECTGALMPLKLEEIYIDNYKSFHKATIRLDNFNIIVGANNAGKTNFVDLLEFIQDAVRYGLVTAVKKKGGFEKIRNFRSRDDFVEVKAVFKKSRYLQGIITFPESFCYLANHFDKYILVFRFTGSKKYFSEIKIQSEWNIKKVSESEFESLPIGAERMDKFQRRLKGGIELKSNISLAKEVEEVDDAVIPNGFSKKEHLEKYKRISRDSGILDDIKFDEGVLDESVDIDIGTRDKNDIDREYYVAMLYGYFDLNNAVAGEFYRENISRGDYLNHLKSNTGFEDFLRKLFQENIKTFDFDVNTIRGSIKPPQSTALDKSGSNLHYILEYLKNGGTLKKYNQKQFEIISASLIGIVDIVEDVVVEEQHMGLDKFPEIIFKERDGFDVSKGDISDGTLALLAIITGLYANRHRHFLVTVEEPETHLHMNAISYLMEVFRGYSEKTQLLITTQSSEVLRNLDLDSDNLVFIYRDNKNMTKFLASRDIDEIKTIMQKYEYNADDIVRGNFLGYLGDYEQTEETT
jgi:predicted ATPase